MGSIDDRKQKNLLDASRLPQYPRSAPERLRVICDGGGLTGSDEGEKRQDEELGLNRSPWKPCCRMSSPATPFASQRQHSVRLPSRKQLPLTFPQIRALVQSAAGLVQL